MLKRMAFLLAALITTDARVVRYGRIASRAAAMRAASREADERVRGSMVMVMGELGPFHDLDEMWRPMAELTDEAKAARPMKKHGPSAKQGRDNGSPRPRPHRRPLRRIGELVSAPIAAVATDTDYTMYTQMWAFM